MPADQHNSGSRPITGDQARPAETQKCAVQDSALRMPFLLPDGTIQHAPLIDGIVRPDYGPWARRGDRECTCDAPPDGEHRVMCPVYEPRLTYVELRQVRALLSERSR